MYLLNFRYPAVFFVTYNPIIKLLVIYSCIHGKRFPSGAVVIMGNHKSKDFDLDKYQSLDKSLKKSESVN